MEKPRKKDSEGEKGRERGRIEVGEGMKDGEKLKKLEQKRNG